MVGDRVFHCKNSHYRGAGLPQEDDRLRIRDMISPPKFGHPSLPTTPAFATTVFSPEYNAKYLRGRNCASVRHGTAHNSSHGIGVVCGFEFQPGALGILLQQAQPFQAATDALADQLNQLPQLAFVRCPDPLKSGATLVLDVPTSAADRE